MRLQLKPKIIKKRYKILIIIVAVILALPVGAYFILQNSSIQTYLTQYFAKKISEQLDAKVSISYVNFTFFNHLLLKDLYVEDQAGDTLLYAQKVSVGIKSLNRKSYNLVFSKIYLRDPIINLKQDINKITNFQFIIDALSSPDSTGAKWDFKAESLELQNAGFSYQVFDKSSKDYGVNFKDIEISKLDLVLKGMRFDGDTTLFNIRHLGFLEKSGFELIHLSSLISLSPINIGLNKLKIETKSSNLDFNRLIFTFKSFESFSDFIARVSVDASFKQSELDFEDIAYFVPKLKGFYRNIHLKGDIKGRVNNFKGENLEIRVTPETYFAADINFIGLPEIDETFIFLDLLNFTTTVADLENIKIPGVPDFKIVIPEQFKNVGKISYEGKFTGFISDFVAYGNLSTSLGKISTDLLLKPDRDNKLHFEGKVRTENFNIGNLLDVDEIGRITLNAQVEGNFLADKGIEAFFEGKIQSLEILNYTYQQINLSGELAENKFDGTVSITDPNLVFQFLGMVDFSEEMPLFDFSAYASKAQLYELNIDKSDSTNLASFLITANFSGNHPDNLEGNIQMLDFKYRKNGKSLNIEDLSLTAKSFENGRIINLESNFLDGEIKGKYEFATLANSFSNFIATFLPAYSENGTIEDYKSKNNFDFYFLVKESEQITDFFIPWFKISKGAFFSGKYYPENLDISISGNIEKLSLANNHFVDFTIQSFTGDSIFKLITKSRQALLFDGYQLDNFDLNSIARDNLVDLELNWDNKGVVKNKGEFSARVNFEKNKDAKMPLIDIGIYPSRIIIADSIWLISQSNIRIDSTAITVGDFMFSSQSQLLNLYGKVSDDPYDTLYLKLDNINLDQFDLHTKTKKFAISGIIDGKANVSNIYKNPFIESDLIIENLVVNEEPLGKMNINSSWNYNSKAVQIHAFTNKGPDRLISLNGNYKPESGELEFALKLNKFNVRVFDGFLEEIFNDIRGIASGEATIKGTIKNPLVNAKISLQKASLLIDYLQTRYSFTHTIEILNNNIIFNNLRMTDSGNNVATVNGSIKSTFFRDWVLDLSINARNFLSLNTTINDNELFYGRVFSTGIIKIAGTPKNIIMDISARTEKNTEFFIPLSSTSELGEVNFLTFVGSNLSDITQQKVYEVNLSGIQLNFDLEVTPDAEIQIIFDSKIGDIIRGKGSGNLKMEINTQGSFNMFGEYIIEQGDYLFTLQNVINKRFDVERGGRISWNGSPYDANVNLRAIYRVRVPLSGLLIDESEQYSRRVPVECQIQMSGKLMSPEMVFNIDAPTADTETRRKLQGVLNTEEKINRQFLSLLIINNFMPEQDFFAGTGTGSTLGMGATTAGVTTASEFLSNQLSNWLSQISREVDIGVNYRPGDEVSSEELEVALSTQVFNDRIRINGNVDMSGKETNASSIVGDFDVDIKLNKSGKIRLKAFTRANDNLRYQVSPYTQGIGIFYREEFDTFDELMKRYWRYITFQKKEE